MDVENCLRYLAAGGIIVVHDCNPLTESAAAPGTSLVASEGLPGFNGTWIWNGDVWKTIAYLRSYREDINVFVLDCDLGLGIISKGKAENMLNLSADKIEKMTLYDLDNNREHILNLKSPGYLLGFPKMRMFLQPSALSGVL